jgi:hypothetical protein
MAFTFADSFALLESQTADWDQADAPGTVKINGTDYACSLDVGSIKPQWNDKTMTTHMVQLATARIRRTLLAACPALGAKVIARGLEWFIESLGEQDDAAIVWSLHLKRVVTKSAS